jgi:hypothetical protein
MTTFTLVHVVLSPLGIRSGFVVLNPCACPSAFFLPDTILPSHRGNNSVAKRGRIVRQGKSKG